LLSANRSRHTSWRNSRKDVELLVVVFGAPPDSGFDDLAEPFRALTWCIHFTAGARNAPTAIQRFEPIHLMRDINPHLAFSVSFLTSPKKHPLYARPWKQWRLAGGEEEGKDVKT
jgi:hypothetical protein